MQCTLCETSYVGKYQHVWCSSTLHRWRQWSVHVNNAKRPPPLVRTTNNAQQICFHPQILGMHFSRERIILWTARIRVVGHVCATCMYSFGRCDLCLSKAMPHIASHTHTLPLSPTIHTDLHSLSLSFTRYFEIDKISARPANKSHVRSDSY